MTPSRFQQAGRAPAGRTVCRSTSRRGSCSAWRSSTRYASAPLQRPGPQAPRARDHREPDDRRHRARDRAARALRALGVRIAVDDFGKGYSSLNYIRRLPIDFLKIDKRFIDSVDADDTDGKLTAAIIGLAAARPRLRRRGRRAAGAARAPKELGCDYAQGFLLARPMVPRRCASFSDDRAGAPPRSARNIVQSPGLRVGTSPQRRLARSVCRRTARRGAAGCQHPRPARGGVETP